MLELYGPPTPEIKFVVNLLTIKGIHHNHLPTIHPTTQKTPTLKDKNLLLTYTHVITDYINTRYPYPDLQPEEPEKRAIILMLCHQITAGSIPPSDLRQYLAHRRPFILGPKISLFDLAVEPHVNDPLYSQDIQQYAQAAKRGIL